MTYRRWVVFLFAVLAAATLLTAQEPAFQLNVNASLLPLEVIVKDASGRPVMDLKKEDFQIYEDGILQKTSRFDMADSPRSIMLIFDRSGSAERQENFVLEAVNVFMRTIRPIDRISIFSFAKEFEVRLNWRSIDKGQLPKVSMGAIQPWSAVYDTLDTAGRRFGNEKGRRGIIMLTDGNDSDFLQDTKRLGEVPDIAKDNTFNGYLKKISMQGIPIYFMAMAQDPAAEYGYLKSFEYLGSTEYKNSRRSPTIAEDFVVGAVRRMQKIAEVTGGGVLVPTRMEDVASYYEGIARELGMSYSLGYSPSNTEAGGKYRNIEVRVLRPGIEVTQSRKGYQP